ncbi:MAG: hypothetical protein JEZ09_04385 [Salinivirgaceae bacterium]|nr:hypothetical protein [Salinivirgaceae bacterium]
MNKFLKYSLLFLIVLGIILTIASSVYSYYRHKYLLPDNFKISSNITTLIIGDSHAESAFNDKLIPNSINIAFHAEHYLFTYFKLKKIVDANPQIDRIVLSFAPHNISQGADVSIFSDVRNSRSFARYFMLLDKDAVMDTYSNSQNWKINYLKWRFMIPFQLKLELKLLFKSAINKPLKISDYPFIGTFYSSKKNNLDNLRKNITAHFFNKENLCVESALSIKYLYKIMKLTNYKEIELVLINTPTYESYRNEIPKFFSSIYSQLIDSIQKKYPLVIIKDYSTMKLDPGDYGDFHHVNIYGAEKVSNQLIIDLK